MNEANLMMKYKDPPHAWDPGQLGGSASLGLSNTRVYLPTNSTANAVLSNRPKTTGKWYVEVKPVQFQNGSYSIIGITGLYWYRYSSSVLLISGTSSRPAYSSVYAVNTIIGMALDVDARTLQFYKNNVAQAVINFAAYTTMANITSFRAGAAGATQAGGVQGIADILAGDSLTYEPPAGFLPW